MSNLYPKDADLSKKIANNIVDTYKEFFKDWQEPTVFSLDNRNCFFINGEWGSGKTFFIKNYLAKDLFKIILGREKNNNKNMKTISFNKFIEANFLHVSLYGVSNISELETQILLSFIRGETKKNEEKEKKQKFLKILKSLSTAFLNVKEIFFELGDRANNIAFKESALNAIKHKILFLDDIDRVSNSSFLKELFSYIDKLKNQECIVIIIGNEKKLQEHFNFLPDVSTLNDHINKTIHYKNKYNLLLDYDRACHINKSLINKTQSLVYKSDTYQPERDLIENKQILLNIDLLWKLYPLNLREIEEFNYIFLSEIKNNNLPLSNKKDKEINVLYDIMFSFYHYYKIFEDSNKKQLLIGMKKITSLFYLEELKNTSSSLRLRNTSKVELYYGNVIQFLLQEKNKIQILESEDRLYISILEENTNFLSNIIEESVQNKKNLQENLVFNIDLISKDFLTKQKEFFEPILKERIKKNFPTIFLDIFFRYFFQTLEEKSHKNKLLNKALTKEFQKTIFTQGGDFLINIQSFCLNYWTELQKLNIWKNLRPDFSLINVSSSLWITELDSSLKKEHISLYEIMNRNISSPNNHLLEEQLKKHIEQEKISMFDILQRIILKSDEAFLYEKLSDFSYIYESLSVPTIINYLQSNPFSSKKDFSFLQKSNFDVKNIKKLIQIFSSEDNDETYLFFETLFNTILASEENSIILAISFQFQQELFSIKNKIRDITKLSLIEFFDIQIKEKIVSNEVMSDYSESSILPMYFKMIFLIYFKQVLIVEGEFAKKSLENFLYLFKKDNFYHKVNNSHPLIKMELINPQNYYFSVFLQINQRAYLCEDSYIINQTISYLNNIHTQFLFLFPEQIIYIYNYCKIFKGIIETGNTVLSENSQLNTVNLEFLHTTIEKLKIEPIQHNSVNRIIGTITIKKISQSDFLNPKIKFSNIFNIIKLLIEEFEEENCEIELGPLFSEQPMEINIETLNELQKDFNHIKYLYNTLQHLPGKVIINDSEDNNYNKLIIQFQNILLNQLGPLRDNEIIRNISFLSELKFIFDKNKNTTFIVFIK